MDISGINSSLLDTLNIAGLKNLLRGKKGKGLTGEDALEEISSEALLATQELVAPKAVRQNLMSGNFASAEREGSRYIAATLASFAAAESMKQSEREAATDILDLFGGLAGPRVYDPNGGGKGGGVTETEVQRRLKMKASKKIMQDAEDDLEKTKKRIEEKAREATAPKDASGNPIPDVTDADPTPVPDADIAQTPAAVDASEVVDAAPTAAAASGAAAPQTGEQAFGPAPKVSINIRV